MAESVAEAVAVPDWAFDMVDLHVHASPSLLPRHGNDQQTISAERGLGFSTVVLKAHEGSTVERAAIAGDGVYGGIVLNSAVGGANPDAVEISARLGGRVVWMPTVSTATHKAGATSPELSVHRGFEMTQVDVIQDGEVLPEWFEVLDLIAQHDLVLASGHLSTVETIILFQEAHRRGIRRLMVNHPKMPFLNWNDAAAQALLEVGAQLELGILPDLLSPADRSSFTLLDVYPHELLVFGADLGHAHHPKPVDITPIWLRSLEEHVGVDTARAIVTTNSLGLLL
jgi:hypothetical protein